MKNYNISLVGRDNLGELLKLLARQVGNSYQSQFPIMDMKTELENFDHEYEDKGWNQEEVKPIKFDFFLAIRKQGVEGGSLEYVKKRCSSPDWKPVIAIRVRVEKVDEYQLSVNIRDENGNV